MKHLSLKPYNFWTAKHILTINTPKCLQFINHFQNTSYKFKSNKKWPKGRRGELGRTFEDIFVGDIFVVMKHLSLKPYNFWTAKHILTINTPKCLQFINHFQNTSYKFKSNKKWPKGRRGKLGRTFGDIFVGDIFVEVKAKKRTIWRQVGKGKVGRIFFSFSVFFSSRPKGRRGEGAN